MSIWGYFCGDFNAVFSDTKYSACHVDGKATYTMSFIVVFAMVGPDFKAGNYDFSHLIIYHPASFYGSGVAPSYKNIFGIAIFGGGTLSYNTKNLAQPKIDILKKIYC
jgi:hypothetical protein